jgi:riboflavin kinase/FMN adenylyltransferase
VNILENFPHELPAAAGLPFVTVGVFDGLHVGHQQLLATLLEVAAGRPAVVVTFDPHPRAVLGPPKRHRLLSPLPERLQLLGRWPLAAVAVLRFDQSIARRSYVDFVRGALVEGLGMRHLVLGASMALGHRRQGTSERLAELGAELGYQLTLVPGLTVDGEIVSSTRVRHRLDAGDVEAARRLLGRPYDLTGTVVRGVGRGRALGIPTANLDIPVDKLAPAHGVYAVAAEVGGQRRAGALNIGVVPTFVATGERSIEVHVLDFEGDLYGTRLRVEFLARLRDERRFAGPEALRAQVLADLEAARRAFSASPGGA